ncbi:Lysosomal thioesterase PPT2 like protein [Eufriesea mexicana]|uniref:lysosomal thioesterase PPT2 homolog n=1 Tax=Eufriesea mexicana TaxID=516756 RepID=UPI00083C8135|nr:PREDICTED: lysosomal thioesterase PPT2 homolog [Eufriesea mexicana]OAD61114.1 Lysosomal thioesterase PPT2 like protein [Eufriesea mexicana]
MTSISYKIIFLLLLLSVFEATVDSYHAVVLIHGILTGSDSMELISDRIAEMHPGTQVYNIPRYAGWSSLESMWHQVKEMGLDILSIGAAYPEGINLVGYSQGGLIARAILQRFPAHNVRNFISLSSPQAGQYGTQFLHLFFPNLTCKTAFELFYSKLGQHTSVGNYWNDPHHQELYYKYNTFLPYVNSEIPSIKLSTNKRGLTKLKRMVLVGGPEDGVITPWQSSHFGYYDANETVIDMRDRSIYKDDLIGIRTLDESERLTLITVPNIPHNEWHKNVSIVDDILLPYLD